jgi:hypothetical protein
MFFSILDFSSFTTDAAVICGVHHRHENRLRGNQLQSSTARERKNLERFRRDQIR